MGKRVCFSLLILVAAGVAPSHAAHADSCSYLRDYANQLWASYRAHSDTDASARLAAAQNAQNAANAQCNLSRQSGSASSGNTRLDAITNALGILGGLGQDDSDDRDDRAADRARQQARQAAFLRQQQAEQERAAQAERERQAAAMAAEQARVAAERADQAERCNSPSSFDAGDGCGSDASDDGTFDQPHTLPGALTGCGASGKFDWSCCPQHMSRLDCVQYKMLGPTLLAEIDWHCGAIVVNKPKPPDYSYDVISEADYERIGRGEATFDEVWYDNMEAWVQSVEAAAETAVTPGTQAYALRQERAKVDAALTACHNRR